MAIDRIPTPTPLTDEEYAQLQIKHELERQKRHLKYDNTKVEAKLVYYKGWIADATVDNITDTYSLNLTDDMLEAYKENNNQLLIIK